MSDAYRIAPQFGNTLPRLSDPLLVVVFSGWIDTSVAAGNAMEALIAETGATDLHLVRVVSSHHETWSDNFKAVHGLASFGATTLQCGECDFA